MPLWGLWGGTAFNEPGGPVVCLYHLDPGLRLLLKTAGGRGWFAVGFRKVSLPMTTIRLCAESW